ncbi:hypothetical protein AB205_0209960 [Aquarana catesbeiana]|uniref:Uncharacterized protein n=1 Tax=Aquarana catesbeiana TaxID=8400 RepID=A0A2G9RN06_AQUCT|nr:hypothetical protein AB205_0209960 [Aquarana catesbeiana]
MLFVRLLQPELSMDTSAPRIGSPDPASDTGVHSLTPSQMC